MRFHVTITNKDGVFFDDEKDFFGLEPDQRQAFSGVPGKYLSSAVFEYTTHYGHWYVTHEVTRLP